MHCKADSSRNHGQITYWIHLMMSRLLWFLVWYAALMAGAAVFTAGEYDDFQSGALIMSGVVVLFIAGITAAYRQANGSPLQGFSFAASCFVPLAWIGVVLLPLNILFRVRSGHFLALVGLGMMFAFCVVSLVWGWWKLRRNA